MDRHTRNYVVIWAVLLAALLGSLGLAEVSASPVVIAAIFAIAAVKALLVVGWFMHLALEPRFLKVLAGGCAALLAALFVGVYPDVALSWSVVGPEDRPAPAAPAALLPGDAARGARAYGVYCVGCHQADGRGNGGTLAANFVEDTTRMARSDEDLLHSIRDGKTGTIGTMPAWKSALNEQQMVDALAYVRATFGARR